ncbi:hypothetical protein CDAR_310041 [Caerostris darwini]|uniref:Uncharacterized protein n=1 Tax=Caerostris darwini TaxID=1538125 RepID=A0AAV4WTA4_9ARAC|nr:hypothetical protein CDAR_310041 [Caerostris darwini]
MQNCLPPPSPNYLNEINPLFEGVVSPPNERAGLLAGAGSSPAGSTSHIRHTPTNAEKALGGGGCRKKRGASEQTILRDPINTRPPTPQGRKEQDIKKMKKRMKRIQRRERERPVEKCLAIKKGQNPLDRF